MSGLIIALVSVAIFCLSGFFLTKWERAVFPRNQQNGEDNEDKNK